MHFLRQFRSLQMSDYPIDNKPNNNPKFQYSCPLVKLFILIYQSAISCETVNFYIFIKPLLKLFYPALILILAKWYLPIFPHVPNLKCMNYSTIIIFVHLEYDTGSIAWIFCDTFITVVVISF